MLMLLALAMPLALIGLIASDDDDNGDDANLRQDGTDNDDTLRGGGADDFLSGLGGEDLLVGDAGMDTLFGNEGEDVLIGGAGSDMLCSGNEDDVVSGNRGNDLIEGQEGDDWVNGDYNNDRVFGNDGNDTVLGGRGMDTVLGNEGDDVLFGGILEGVPLNEDELVALRDGDALADILGDSGMDINPREDERADFLSAGAGDDVLFVGAGDEAHGGAGADTFHMMVDDDAEELGEMQIADFNPRVDTISVVFDAPLDIDTVTVSAEGDDAVVFADGMRIGIVTGAAGSLSAADILIIEEDTLVGLFDPNT